MTPAWLTRLRYGDPRALIGELPPASGTAEHRGWVAGSVLALIGLAGLALLLSGCVPKPKPPEPPPTPEPDQAKYLNLLLRNDGAGHFAVDGQRFRFVGCIPGCCMGAEPDISPAGWPLTSRVQMDYAVQRGGCTAFHVRPGPFLAVTEPEFAAIGGSYVEVSGKADLSQFNPAFDAYLVDLVDYAGQKGAVVEVNVADTWRVKHTEIPHPWRSGDNVQGFGFLAAVGRQPIKAGDYQDQWIAHLVEKVGCYGNVIWLIDNEGGQLLPRLTDEWERSAAERLRYWEQQVGCQVVHMIGENTERDSIESASWIDYIQRHDRTPTEPWFRKPTGNNEENPDRPCDQTLWQFCRAWLGGAYKWYWRAGHSREAMDCTLAKFKAAAANNCAGVDVSGCPFKVQPTAALGCRAYGMHGGYPATDCTRKDARNQPIWAEGDSELRSACEWKSSGALHYALANVVGTLVMDIEIHGGSGFRVRGHGTADAVCTADKMGQPWRGCVDAAGEPFKVVVP